MVLARSMSGTIGGHAPIISIHDTWCSEARGSAILIGQGPNALSIRPTDFVTDETRTHNPEIMRPMLYRLS